MKPLRICSKIGLFLVIMLAWAALGLAQTRVHEVKQGETLTSIAQAYQMTAGELRALNKLTSERVEVGQKLKVRDIDPVPPAIPQSTTGVGNLPAQTVRTAQDTAATRQPPRMTRSVETPAQNDPPTRTTATQTPEPAAGPAVRVVESTHVVKAGETLFSIARQYNLSVADLKKFNNIVGNDVSAGQSLKVFQTVVTTGSEQVDRQIEEQSSQVQEEEAEVVHEEAVATEQTDSVLTDSLQWYTVRSGDSLPSIARDFKMSVSELREYNGLTENRVYPGDRLRVRANPDAMVEQPAPEQPPVMIIDPPIEEQEEEQEREQEAGKEQEEEQEEQEQEQGQEEEREQEQEPPVAEEPDDDSLQSVTLLTQSGRFVGHTVKRNERLSAILETYQMEEAEFYALNPSLDGRPPRAGIEVLVYEPPANLQANPYLVGSGASGSSSEQAHVYAESDKGKLTSSGELYNPINLTAAHAQFPLGTILYVVNPATGRSAYVRVNDGTEKTGIVLSEAAAKALGLNQNTLGMVSVSRE